MCSLKSHACCSCCIDVYWCVCIHTTCSTQTHPQIHAHTHQYIHIYTPTQVKDLEQREKDRMANHIDKHTHKCMHKHINTYTYTLPTQVKDLEQREKDRMANHIDASFMQVTFCVCAYVCMYLFMYVCVHDVYTHMNEKTAWPSI